MQYKYNSQLSSPLLGFLIGITVSLSVSANTDAFTNAQISQLQALCADNSMATLATTGKKRILLFHKDGYIPAIHAELPNSVRADDLESAAAVLCLEDVIDEIETCNFSIFFSIPRERYQFRVEAVPLNAAGSRLENAIINGSSPESCEDSRDIDNSVASIIGNPVSVENILDFITANNLDRQDNDRDGLRNLEEFKIGTNPDSANSPAAQSNVRINGTSSAQLYQGETAEIRIDLYPGPFLGNAAEYFFWADFPDGQYTFQLPAGLVKSSVIEPALSAPLVRLFNARLQRLNNLPAGDYQFYFEARDNDRSVEFSTATLTIFNDNCRTEMSLPFSFSEQWQTSCKSTAESEQGYLARYFTFTLSSQSDLVLELETNGSNAELILRDGSGRTGFIVDRSESFTNTETLSASLESGDYTLEVMLRRTTSGGRSFALSSRSETIPWQFTDVTEAAGINHLHGYLEQDIDTTDPSYERILQGAGVAAGDYDQDGWMDLYVTSGSNSANLLYHNLGDGTFTNTAEQAGLALQGRKDTGATFADVDGDGWPDLFMGGVNGTPAKLFLNNQDGTFSDITDQSGLINIENAYGASFADYDKDGDLDVFITHWNTNSQGNYLFQNDGSAVFTDISTEAGIPDGLMADYTPNFTDIDNDGWLDLLIAADFNTSQVYLNNRDGSFTNITNDDVITDDNGMGAAVGDYDNDGDIDWFVSSIYDPNGVPGDIIPGTNTGATGNRLYQNDGNGSFTDVTENAGVRIGGWGWGSCFTDFNNDSWLDLFHVNGYVTQNFNNNAFFLSDGSRIFISNQDGTFSGSEELVNLADTGQGRGVACFDYDLDGDIDIFVANNQQTPSLYRNDGGNDMNFLYITVAGESLNSSSVGARIFVTTGELTQLREIYAGNNFISNNPAEAYFGVGQNDIIDEIKVVWPSGEEKILENVSANQMLTIFK